MKKDIENNSISNDNRALLQSIETTLTTAHNQHQQNQQEFDNNDIVNDNLHADLCNTITSINERTSQDVCIHDNIVNEMNNDCDNKLANNTLLSMNKLT